uniref:Uncharacterized protein n=1 Tax=Solanum lycopersicum TaxID=4081 RepID=K4BLB1_SOLLC
MVKISWPRYGHIMELGCHVRRPFRFKEHLKSNSNLIFIYSIKYLST